LGRGAVGVQQDLTQKFVLPALGGAIKEVCGKKFIGVTIDYPWPIELKMNKDRLFLGYQTLKRSFLDSLNLSEVQDEGYLFFWTVNSMFLEAIEYVLRQGYQ
jgi:N6-adenosine-specific RNA methylase IME4